MMKVNILHISVLGALACFAVANPECTTQIANRRVVESDAIEIGVSRGLTLEACAEQCRCNSQCQAFAYDFDPEESIQMSECELYNSRDLQLRYYNDGNVYIIDAFCAAEECGQSGGGGDNNASTTPEEREIEFEPTCATKIAGVQVINYDLIELASTTGISLETCANLCQCNQECKTFSYEYDPQESLMLASCDLFTSGDISTAADADSVVYILDPTCLQQQLIPANVCNSLQDFSSSSYCARLGSGLSGFEAPQNSVTETGRKYRLGLRSRVSLQQCANSCLRKPSCDSFFYRAASRRCAMFSPEKDGTRKSSKSSASQQHQMYNRIRCPSGCEYESTSNRRNANWEDQLGPRISGVTSEECAAKCDASVECRTYVHRASNNRCWLFDGLPDRRSQNDFTIFKRTGQCLPSQ